MHLSLHHIYIYASVLAIFRVIHIWCVIQSRATFLAQLDKSNNLLSCGSQVQTLQNVRSRRSLLRVGSLTGVSRGLACSLFSKLRNPLYLVQAVLESINWDLNYVQVLVDHSLDRCTKTHHFDELSRSTEVEQSSPSISMDFKLNCVQLPVHHFSNQIKSNQIKSS